MIESSPAQGIDLPRLPKRGKRGIAEVDVQAFLRISAGHRRNYSIITFLECSGCRLAGMANLRPEDLDMSNPDRRLRKRAFVIEKGDQERVVFMSKRAYFSMRRWLDVRPASMDTVWGLAPRGIYEVLRRYASKLDLQGKWSPHEWRHRAGRRWITQGMHLSHVSQILGHSSTYVTDQFYGQFNVDELQEAYEGIVEVTDIAQVQGTDKG
ncbi:MAG: tyrosine-type recombinase/integrase [Chloroflexi bacterium]|nr:tyrosine-type recombinase/integrase [Chloroflexota bacterium]